MDTPEVKAKISHRSLILVTCSSSTCKLKRLHLTDLVYRQITHTVSTSLQVSLKIVNPEFCDSHLTTVRQAVLQAIYSFLRVATGTAT